MTSEKTPYFQGGPERPTWTIDAQLSALSQEASAQTKGSKGLSRSELDRRRRLAEKGKPNREVIPLFDR